MTGSGVASHSEAHRQKLYQVGPLSGLSQNNHSVVFRISTCVPNSVNDMACCIISFKPLTDLG